MAPALAASPTTSQKILDWDAYASGTTPPGSVTLSGSTSPTNPTTVTRSVTYGQDDNGSPTAPGANSNRAVSSNEGGNVGNYLRLGMGTTANTITEGDDVRLTFTFSRPVYDLTFWIYDIDWVNSGSVGHDDMVYLTPGFTTLFKGSNLEGAGAPDGTGDGPWLAINAGDSTTSNANSVRVRYPGPITTFSLYYYNGTSSEGYNNSHIGLGDLTFRS